jgi:hypothetical protein
MEVSVKMTGSEGGRWMELAKNLAHWRSLLLAMVNLWVLLPVG